jgi:hypothetical protein
MISSRIFTFTCGFCNKPTELKEAKLQMIIACPHCGQVLYEMDDENPRLRLTKEFRSAYSQMLAEMKELRTLLKDLEIQSKKTEPEFSTELNPALMTVNINIINLIKKLINENELSDSDTRDSAGSALGLISSQTQRISSLINEATDMSHSAFSEKVAELRKGEKEIFMFIRMLDKYLKIKSDLY